jgi:tetratricopeptide (TPR) repeat protein
MSKKQKDKPRQPAARTVTAWFPLLIVLAGVCAYANSFQGAFVLDDYPQIVNNRSVHQLWPLSKSLTASRPIVQLSLAINYELGGTNVRGYHVVNLGIHLLAALTLYGLARRTLAREKARERFGGSDSWTALAIALIWVVHPLTTQAVTYIIQRGESLMSLFYLLTLYAVVRGVDSPRRAWWYGGAVCACALGMVCKPIMVTAPLVVLLYDRIFIGPTIGDIFRRRWGLYAGLAATWGLLVVLLLYGPKEWQQTAGGAAVVSTWEYARTQPGVVAHYLGLVFWPMRFCLDYGWPVAQTAAEILPGMAVVVLLLVVTFLLGRRWPGVAFLGVSFFIVLAPSSSVLPIADLAFEHRMYLSLAAVIAAVVLAGRALIHRAGARWQWDAARRRWIATVLVALITLVLAGRTVARNRDYASQRIMWEDVLAYNPGHYRAHHALGAILADAGETEQAVNHYREVLRLKPRFSDAHNNLANVLMAQRKTAEAIEHYRTAVELNPRYVSAHYNLGRALAQINQIDDAILHYTEAIRLDPQYGSAHNNMALLLVRQGRFAEAEEHYRAAIRINPKHVEAHYNLGLAYFKQQRYPEAIDCYQEALRLRPNYAEARVNLGMALVSENKPAEAVSHFAQALQIKPNLATAHYGLGLAHERQGKPSEAASDYNRALKLQPNFSAARAALNRVNGAGTSSSSDIDMSVDSP